jgi:hypothetical protein
MKPDTETVSDASAASVVVSDDGSASMAVCSSYTSAARNRVAAMYSYNNLIKREGRRGVHKGRAAAAPEKVIRGL